MAEIADRKPGEKPVQLKQKLKGDLQDIIEEIHLNFHETGERQIIKQSLYSAMEMWDRLEEIE